MSEVLEQEGIGRDAALLDVGTSTGTNLRLLKEMGFTNYRGLDPSDEAIRFCAQKGLGKVEKGSVENLPIENDSLQAVLLTDILEHVDDRKALAEVFRALKPGGKAIITVPAFQGLWGLQDEVSNHLRRYTKKEILDLVKGAGFSVGTAYYFNYFLFFPIWLARQIIRIFKIKLKSENEVNSPLINKILTAMFALDIRTAKVLKPPFGVSIFVLAKKG